MECLPLYAALFVTALTAALAVACIIARVRRNREGYDHLVCLPFRFAVIGMLAGAGFCAAAIVSALSGETLSLGFSAFDLVCCLLMNAYLSKLVRYDRKGFTCRSFFGVTRECPFRDVEGVHGENNVHVYFQGRSYFLDEASAGLAAFLSAMRRAYKREYNRPLPKVRLRRDPMNGHLEEPWVYLVLWLIVAALAVSMIPICFYSMLHVPPSEKLQTVQTAFRAREVKSEELYLAAVSAEGTYCLERYDLYENLPEPSFFCSGETFTVGTKPDREDIFLLVGEDGTEYVTPELWLRAYQKESLVPFVLFMLFCVFMFAYACFGIALTRHPERYSPRIRRLVYQEGVLINVDEPESTKNTPPRPADHNKRKGRYRL